MNKWARLVDEVDVTGRAVYGFASAVHHLQEPMIREAFCHNAEDRLLLMQEANKLILWVKELYEETEGL